MNVDIGTGRAIPRKGIHQWDFRCSARYFGKLSMMVAQGTFFLLNSSKITRIELAVGFIHFEDRAV
jgi:hypothetical protein